MPGHKGTALLGFEPYDITEFVGADSLYEASGIIRESEKNASGIFGANTFYSTEGSSLCIRAMLYLVELYARENGKRATVVAGRNAHKTFLSAVALLDIDVQWLYPENNSSYLSCDISASSLEAFLTNTKEKPTAVYITSPDYLGNTLDIKAISKLCRAHGVLLLVDNAHGAYLKFLERSEHPIDLGADLCCDSAHKTLPALTGAAYLHVSHSAPDMFAAQAKTAMAMFGSTSPSYLILQSLDAVNKYICNGYTAKLGKLISNVARIKDALADIGYSFIGNEPAKLTLCAKAYGYTGTELSKILHESNIVCEFFDPDFVVLMLTPETGRDGVDRLYSVLSSVPRKNAIGDSMPRQSVPQKEMSVREATMSANEVIPAKDSLGRVLASVNLACPPAVPIIVCGERIDSDTIRAFDYYGIESVRVVNQRRKA